MDVGVSIKQLEGNQLLDLFGDVAEDTLERHRARKKEKVDFRARWNRHRARKKEKVDFRSI